jgi:hypothetical protein
MRHNVMTRNDDSLEHDEPRIVGEWDETEDEYEHESTRLEDASDGYTIESEFRGGSERVRDENGEYKSLSVAIRDKYANFTNVTPADIAQRFDVSVQTAREHMDHLRENFQMGGQSPAPERIQERKEEQRMKSRAEDTDARTRDNY